MEKSNTTSIISNTNTNNDQALNTLKEISDLKSEIMKLTTSLRKLKVTPEKEKPGLEDEEGSEDEDRQD